MSMLSSQCDGLREVAGRLEGYQNGEISRMLREAADTITSLWNSLTASEAALNKAAGNWAKADSQIRENQSMRWHELFGTPERAARTLEKGKTLCAWCDKQTCSTNGGECRIFDYDALLEWLRGEGE